MRGSQPDLELWRQEIEKFYREFTAELDTLFQDDPQVSPREFESSPPEQPDRPVLQPQAVLPEHQDGAGEAEARLQQLKRSLSEKLANAPQPDA